MVIKTLKRASAGITPVIVLFILLLVSLHLMNSATQNSAEFGRLYSALLVINVLEMVVLVGMITANLYRLVRQYREREVGSRLTLRLVIIFTVLAVAPVSLVYYFSLNFIQRGIDSWFDVRVEKALKDALDLSRTTLDTHMRDLLHQTELTAREIEDTPNHQAIFNLDRLRHRGGASDLTLLTSRGQIIAASSDDQTMVIPTQPSDAILAQLRQGSTYVGLDPIRDTGLYIRIVVNVPGFDPATPPRVLQALYPVAGRVSELAESVQSVYARYQELGYLREPLKFTFTLTLSLALALSLLMAVWAAFFSARRLAEPIRVLALGTRAVAEGDYNQRLPALPAHDELGILVQSFNDMTRKIAEAANEAEHSRHLAEQQRAYLEIVLGRLSSGVLTLDARHVLRTINAAAKQILGADLSDSIGEPICQLSRVYPHLGRFSAALAPHLTKTSQEWREEVTLFGAGGRQVFMCRGAALPDGQGHVIVIDDITALIQAQRDAAWGEVARRLAHEIKNPLTPIQLSAERLRHKYLKTMSAEEADVLDRSTHTIIQQVQSMQEMVKAFSDYARAPRLMPQPLDLNRLINEVLDLYRGDDSRVRIQTRLESDLPEITGDTGRFRQLLHNLIKNAVEAVSEGNGCCVTVSTHRIREADRQSVELRAQDNGPGIAPDILERLFEPGVTGKAKGSGLGLAVVKKIVEEHGGVVWAENMAEGGACIVIRLPLPVQNNTAMTPPSIEDKT
ncbi:MAG: ATP-binding protein [Pseudomonadota bacterium]